MLIVCQLGTAKSMKVLRLICEHLVNLFCFKQGFFNAHASLPSLPSLPKDLISSRFFGLPFGYFSKNLFSYLAELNSSPSDCLNAEERTTLFDFECSISRFEIVF